MRVLPESLDAHLKTGVTTLCRCVRLTRRDGAVFAFTDHDAVLTVDGTAFDPIDAMAASEWTAASGFAVGGLEVDGVLSDDTLSEEDLAAGLFDDARIELFLVNWQAPEEAFLEGAGTLGEVRRADSAFTAEVRGPLAALEKRKGRLFAQGCDADLGDARCGVDLSLASHRIEGTVVEKTGDHGLVVGPGLHARGLFNEGLLTVTSGARSGFSAPIRRQVPVIGGAWLDLWRALPQGLVEGDAVIVTAGCDKRFATCRDRFVNAQNFRGFPHMPGNDVALGYQAPGQNR
ncbi:MAG: DUF2163 domain-containing protein [Hyphomicrobiaceae bacterium]|nr:DUF2163 domain-containing protein [Hyphomicrobiaceae bacterium]